MSELQHPTGDTASSLLQQLWLAADLPATALEHVSLHGALLPSCFRIGDVAATCTAAGGLAAAEIWRH